MGGNILVVPLVRQQIGQSLVDLLLSLQDDIRYNTRMGAYFARLEGVDGSPIRLEQESGPPRTGATLPLVIRETDRPDLHSGVLLAGRDLQPDDYGKPVIVLSEQSLVESTLRDFTLADLGVYVGSTVTMRINNRNYDFEVIGLVTSPNGVIPNFGGAFLPPGLFSLDTAYAHRIE